MNRRLGILIATRNRPEDLKRLLTSLEGQTEKDFSVTIIDASDKEALAVKDAVSSFRKLDISFCHTDRRGSCTQRNFGLNMVKEDIVLISDDDCIYEADTIERVFQFIAENPHCAAFGLNVIEKQKPVSRFKAFLKKGVGLSHIGRDYIVRKNGINVIGDTSNPQLRIEWLPSTALVIVRHKICQKDLICFNTELEKLSGYASGEDAYLTYNLFLHGYPLGLATNARVHHIPSPRVRDNQQLMYQVRIFNRYLLWRDLIYSRDKRALYSYLASNVILLFQYSLGLLTFNLNYLRGFFRALRLIIKDFRGGHTG